MNLNDKIVTIIDGLNLSNTKFADNIDVSRPTISHIISGRNKPSIDVIQKIMVKYPELGHKWFLDDEILDESKLSQVAENEAIEPVKAPDSSNGESHRNSGAGVSEVKVERKATQDVRKSPQQESSSFRKVEKIIIFYSDGTMEVMSGPMPV